MASDLMTRARLSLIRSAADLNHVTSESARKEGDPLYGPSWREMYLTEASVLDSFIRCWIREGVELSYETHLEFLALRASKMKAWRVYITHSGDDTMVSQKDEFNSALDQFRLDVASFL